MATLRYRGGTASERASLADDLVIAVDLGFAKSSKSCGLAWRTPGGELQAVPLGFGDCIARVGSQLRSVLRAVLILEAPLSGLFNATGNPRERGRFEQRDTDEGIKQRYWYSGPGAATCLAAIFFCRELRAVVRDIAPADQATTLILYEGFVSFKPQRTDHCEDARRLRDGFLDPTRLADIVTPEPGPDEDIVTVTDIIADQSGGGIPAILVVDYRLEAAGPV